MRVPVLPLSLHSGSQHERHKHVHLTGKKGDQEFQFASVCFPVRTTVVLLPLICLFSLPPVLVPSAPVVAMEVPLLSLMCKGT